MVLTLVPEPPQIYSQTPLIITVLVFVLALVGIIFLMVYKGKPEKVEIKAPTFRKVSDSEKYLGKLDTIEEEYTNGEMSYDAALSAISLLLREHAGSYANEDLTTYTLNDLTQLSGYDKLQEIVSQLYPGEFAQRLLDSDEKIGVPKAANIARNIFRQVQ